MEKLISLATNPQYKDSRGVIQMVLENCDVKSVSRISSTTEASRANHWHRDDSHWILINYGAIDIYEAPIDNPDLITKTQLKAGDVFFTGPRVIHEMFFPAPTEFDCFSALPRNSSSYESDTVRVSFSLKERFERAAKRDV